MDGDPVGTSVGLEDGETDGPLLGLDVGCNKTDDDYDEKVSVEVSSK